MLSRLYRYGQWPNTHDLLKVFAITLMIADHIGAYIFPHEYWLRVIGRGAAPCFFFLAGLTPSKKPKISLWIYGAILSVLYWYTEHYFMLNILINFGLVRLFFLWRQDAPWTSQEITTTFTWLVLINLLCYPIIEYGTSSLLFAISAQLLLQKNERASGCLMVAIMNHFFWEMIGMPQNIPTYYWLFHMCIACMTYLILLFYRERTWHPPFGTQTLILLFSRYSLEIYFWHLLLLRLWYFRAALFY